MHRPRRGKRSLRPRSGWPWPDPALGPPRAGLRPRRHPPNRLPVWCLDQAEVWCDFFGNDHVIDQMQLDYVKKVIGFLKRHSELLFGLRLADLYTEAIELSLLGLDGSDAFRERAAQIEAFGPDGSLEASPLMVALRRRLREGQAEGEAGL